MNYFVYILVNNIVPICIMIAIGVAMYRAFRIDIRTLSKLNFYVFSPALVFVKLYESEMRLPYLMQVLLFFVIFFSLLFAIIEVIIRIQKMQRGMRIAMRNSVIFYNSANYALPLNQTVFGGNAYTLAIQIVIMIMQTLIPNTYGIYTLNAHKASWKATIENDSFVTGYLCNSHCPVVAILPCTCAIFDPYPFELHSKCFYGNCIVDT